MAKDQELLRALIRETLKLSDRDKGIGPRSPFLVDPLGPHVRVYLDGKSWLTRSQAEVDRVIASGGKVERQENVGR